MGTSGTLARCMVSLLAERPWLSLGSLANVQTKNEDEGRRTLVISCVLLCTQHFHPTRSHGKIVYIASRQHSMSHPQSSS